MAELKDYSGEYIPNMSWDLFSKEVLVKVIEAYAKLYLMIDGLWNTELSQRHSRDEGFDIEEVIWKKLAVLEPREMTRILNIQGTDIVAFVKMMQVMASFHPSWYKQKIEVKDKNRAVLTVIDCPQLRYFERHGDVHGMKRSCQEIEYECWSTYAQFMNPKTKTKALKLPPRESPGEIACQWEFWIED